MVDKVGKGHRLVMENREQIALTGVQKVQSFDPKEIVLETELGILNVPWVRFIAGRRRYSQNPPGSK